MLAFQQVYVNLVMTEAMNEGNRWFGNFDIIWALDYICDAILDNVDASSSLVNCLVFQRALWSWNSSICPERNNFFKLTFWYSICRKTATATWFYVKDFRFHIRSVVLYSLTIFPQGQYFVGIFVFNIWMQGLLMKECLLRRNIFMICALLFKVFRKMLLNWE